MSEPTLIRKCWQCKHGDIEGTFFAFDTNPPTGVQQWAILGTLWQTGLNALYSDTKPPEIQDWMVEGSIKQRLIILDVWDIEEIEYAVEATMGTLNEETETREENTL